MSDEKLYSSKEFSEKLNKACELYGELSYYKRHTSSLINAKNTGLTGSFDFARSKIKTLVEEVNQAELHPEPVFKKIILNLTKSYRLNK